MITYTGRGGIAGALFIFQAMAFGLVSGLQGGKQPFGGSVWPWLLAAVLGAGICWLVGRRVNRGLRPRFIDCIRENGREYAEGHTFFHVRLEYTGLITVPLMLVIYFVVANAG